MKFFYIIKIYKYWNFYEYFLKIGWWKKKELVKIGWWKKKKLVLFKINKLRKDEKNFNIYN